MTIPLSRPPVDDELKAAVIAAVESGQYILGPECKAFEREFAAYNGAKHAVLTTNATAALWMVIKAFGAKAGDEVLVPSHTAFPTVEAIRFEIGFNLRFNDIQAAVGRVFLRRLDAMNDHRRKLAARYTAGLAGLPLVLPAETRGARHVYHLYVVRTPQRDQLAAFLKDKGVATGIHYPVACHRQPAVEHLKAPPLEHTDRIVKEILTLPIWAGHTEAEIDEVVAGVKAFFRK